jgi:hypothetical protein
VSLVGIAATVAGCGGTIKVLDGMEVRCSDKSVSVINEDGRLEARPNSVKVCRGNAVVLTFRNGVPTGHAHTRKARPATTTEMWLDVDNTSMDGITIMVPDATTPMEYKYSLAIDGLGTLDPRIVVQ